MSPYEQVLAEARKLHAEIKSVDGRNAMMVIIHLLEVLVFDEIRTPWPAKFHDKDDALGLPR